MEDLLEQVPRAVHQNVGVAEPDSVMPPLPEMQAVMEAEPEGECEDEGERVMVRGGVALPGMEGEVVPQTLGAGVPLPWGVGLPHVVTVAEDDVGDRCC